MRLHVLGLPHTDATRAYEWCAYTAKVRKFCDMMVVRGHDVTLYGGERHATRASLVTVVTDDERESWFPDFDPTKTYWDPSGAWDPESPWWTAFNLRAIREIRERSERGDYLCVIAGTAQRPVVDALPELVPVEWGVGYGGVFAPYRVYESHAWAHYLAARSQSDDARLYDAVIPNSFELDAFPQGRGDGGYFLFVGRVVGRKGPAIAAEACKRLGARLLIAGQNVAETGPGYVLSTDGTRIEGDVEYVGLVGPEDRARLMGGAIALFAPTTYLEPFGGVAVEAMMTGTPAITTDWGAFTETVDHGVSGYRCRLLRDFVRAAELAPSLDRSRVRAHALRYTTDAVSHEYDRYFADLETLKSDGWYA